MYNTPKLPDTSDSNKIRTHNYLIRKRSLHYLATLVKWLSCAVSVYLYGYTYLDDRV